jgi:type VI secretion system protein
MSSLRRAGSLFERLTPGAPGVRSLAGKNDAADRLHGIKRHLQRLFNARYGASLSSPAYGLLDFNDAAMGTAELTRRISADIQRLVEAFEPRVTAVTVACRPDPATPANLLFRLHCLVRDEGEDRPSEVEMTMMGLERRMRIL